MSLKLKEKDYSREVGKGTEFMRLLLFCFFDIDPKFSYCQKEEST